MRGDENCMRGVGRGRQSARVWCRVHGAGVGVQVWGGSVEVVRCGQFVLTKRRKMGVRTPGDDIATPPADGRSEEGCCDAMGCASMLGAPAELVERSAMEEVEGRRERSARTAERTKAGRHAVIHEGERAVVCSD